MLRRLLAYSEKVFDLSKFWDSWSDTRPKPEIAARVFPMSLLIMFLCRLPSLNALESYRHQRSWRRYLGHKQLPCSDEIAYVSERMDPQQPREILTGIYHKLMRNKVLLPIRGHRLAVVDGHEINSSYCRCCPQCLRRQIEVHGKLRTQFYHRIVVFQLIGPDFQLLIDVELQAPGEDETTTALRLIQRVIDRLPRSFDILLADALYARAPVMNLLLKHGKHALVVLKDDRRDLLKDAQALFARRKAKTFQRQQTSCQYWDLEDFTSWSQVDQPLRVVRSLESTPLTEYREGKKQQRLVNSEWIWATTLSSSEVPAPSIIHFGHERWRIENEGFNELCNRWHADHYFHHHPVSILIFWLMLFIAHALFHCFLRNLKPAIRASYPILFWTQQIAAHFFLDQWFSSG